MIWRLEIWAVVLQAGFFITPILYPLSIFSPALQEILRLNPIAQIIVTARDSILYSVPPYLPSLVYPGVAAVIVFIVGYKIFQKLEPRFAEEI